MTVFACIFCVDCVCYEYVEWWHFVLYIESLWMSIEFTHQNHIDIYLFPDRFACGRQIIWQYGSTKLLDAWNIATTIWLLDVPFFSLCLFICTLNSSWIQDSSTILTKINPILNSFAISFKSRNKPKKKLFPTFDTKIPQNGIHLNNSKIRTNEWYTEKKINNKRFITYLPFKSIYVYFICRFYFFPMGSLSLRCCAFKRIQLDERTDRRAVDSVLFLQVFSRRCSHFSCSTSKMFRFD